MTFEPFLSSFTPFVVAVFRLFWWVWPFDHVLALHFSLSSLVDMGVDRGWTGGGQVTMHFCAEQQQAQAPPLLAPCRLWFLNRSNRDT